MSSSGTFSFAPSNGSIVLSAFERLQIRLPSLRQEHFVTAQREFNFMLASQANMSPNLWEVELVSQTLMQGVATYDVNPKVIMVLDVYISLNQGQASQTDRFIEDMSRTEYATIAQKQTPGFPTVFWFDRLINPTLTLWPVPDNNGPYTMNYYACTQMQDANLPGGETPDVPYRWLDALVAGLAHRLSRVYAPQMEQQRKGDAQEAWQIAASQDTEGTGISMAPMISTYYRN